MNTIIAIDPGDKKCGLIIADIENDIVLEARVVQAFAVIGLISEWQKVYNIQLYLLGNGTKSKQWKLELSSSGIGPIKLINEAGTTLRARERYLELFPLPFIFCWFPKGLILPPRNLDFLAALLLIEDYLKRKIKLGVPVNFKIWPEQ